MLIQFQANNFCNSIYIDDNHLRNRYLETKVLFYPSFLIQGNGFIFLAISWTGGGVIGKLINICRCL